MSIPITITLYGQEKFKTDMELFSAKQTKAVARAIAASGLRIQAKARRNAPADTSRLRSSINLLFYSNGLVATIGSNLDYAAFVEFGTGPLGKATCSIPTPPGYTHGGTHGLPPAQALMGWARRHKVNAWAVAIAIWKRGGNPARPYLTPAFYDELPTLVENLKRAVQVF